MTMQKKKMHLLSDYKCTSIMSYVPLRSKYIVGTRQSELALIQTERYVLNSYFK